MSDCAFGNRCIGFCFWYARRGSNRRHSENAKKNAEQKVKEIVESTANNAVEKATEKGKKKAEEKVEEKTGTPISKRILGPSKPKSQLPLNQGFGGFL